MKTTNKLSNKYISEVKKNLKCSSKKRKEFLDTLTPEIYNFELDHPHATYDDYQHYYMEYTVMQVTDSGHNGSGDPNLEI